MAKAHIIKEVVGIFDNFDHLQEAISQLEASGFERRYISVLGSKQAVKDTFGQSQLPPELLEDHPDAPRAPNISQEELGIGQGVVIGTGMLTGVVAAIIASGGLALPGALVTTVVAGGVGGAAVGAVLAKLLGDSYAEFFEKQIEDGGLLLWVTTPDPVLEVQAQSILREHGARDIHIHQLQGTTESGEEEYEPQVFSDAFIHLNQLAASHKALMQDDKMLKAKIDHALEHLQSTAAAKAPVPPQQAEAIAREVEGIALYAKDMAEEEQRIIAEAHAEAAGQEEKQIPEYFALATSLADFASQYRRNTTASELLVA